MARELQVRFLLLNLIAKMSKTKNKIFFVFSRVPSGMGNRNCQQSPANDDSEARADHNGDLSGDGLTALVGLSQGGSTSANIHGEQTVRGYEMDLQNRISGTSTSGPSASSIPVQMLESSLIRECNWS